MIIQLRIPNICNHCLFLEYQFSPVSRETTRSTSGGSPAILVVSNPRYQVRCLLGIVRSIDSLMTELACVASVPVKLTAVPEACCLSFLRLTGVFHSVPSSVSRCSASASVSSLMARRVQSIKTIIDNKL